MPSDELIGEIVRAALRTVSLAVRFAFEWLFHELLAGTGRMVVRLVSPHTKPGEVACAAVGLLLYVLLCLVAGIIVNLVLRTAL
jgi:hypothetical protein